MYASAFDVGLLILLCGLLPSSVAANACWVSGVHEQGRFDRIVAIGDVHGSFNGLTELLIASNVTSTEIECV